MSLRNYYIYILSNKNNSVLYTGVTNDLERRIYEHKHKLSKGFTARYNINKLLYYEIAMEPEVAISREKQIKDMRRERKMELIIKLNPGMNDLSDELFDQ